jgi:hypothetical protein
MTLEAAFLIAKALDKANPGRQSRDFDLWVDLVSSMRKLCIQYLGYNHSADWDRIAYGYQWREIEDSKKVAAQSRS